MRRLPRIHSARPRAQATGRAAAWLLAASVGVGGVAACGSTARPQTIRLRIASPLDGARVSSATVAVAGDVSPADASVLVLGRRVAVHRGGFSTEVRLSLGTNVVDVMAGLRGAHGAMGAVWIYRYSMVSLPDIVGDSPDAGASRLHAIDLDTRLQVATGFLESILPLPEKVCGTSPGAGSSVVPGSLVLIQVAKVC